MTTLINIWLIKGRYHIYIFTFFFGSISSSVRLGLVMKKKIKTTDSELLFFQMHWVAVAAVAKTALNNRILTRRLQSKQHEEISKAEPPPLSHAFETTVQKMSDESPFVQAEQWSKAQERHWLPICLFIQPRDGDWTNSSFPLKLDQTGVCIVGEGCCHMWREEREDLSWERALRSKPWVSKPSGDWCKQLASNKGFIPTTFCILFSHSTHPGTQAQSWTSTPQGQDMLRYLDEWIK